MSYELFVEVTRNGTVESRHFGAAVVCDAKGNVVESWGNIDNLIFPRSALKPMLAIQLVESGASTRYALNDAELSLACSSHQGEQIHQDLVVSWLNRLGLSEDHLACGPGTISYRSSNPCCQQNTSFRSLTHKSRICNSGTPRLFADSGKSSL